VQLVFLDFIVLRVIFHDTVAKCVLNALSLKISLKYTACAGSWCCHVHLLASRKCCTRIRNAVSWGIREDQDMKSSAVPHLDLRIIGRRRTFQSTIWRRVEESLAVVLCILSWWVGGWWWRGLLGWLGECWWWWWVVAGGWLEVKLSVDCQWWRPRQ
jgi:hypothetical protein